MHRTGGQSGERSEPGGPRDGRHRLTRDTVVHTAIEIADLKGLSGLTMRGLGAALGVEAMSLYRYLDGRDDLLAAMRLELTATLRFAHPATPVPWRRALAKFAEDLHHVAGKHPRLVHLLAGQVPREGGHRGLPVILPPLQSLDVVEELFGVLTAHGFDDSATAAAYRSYCRFLLGSLLSLPTAPPPGAYLSGSRHRATVPEVSPGAAQHPLAMRFNGAVQRAGDDANSLSSERVGELDRLFDLLEGLRTRSA